MHLASGLTRSGKLICCELWYRLTCCFAHVHCKGCVRPTYSPNLVQFSLMAAQFFGVTTTVLYAQHIYMATGVMKCGSFIASFLWWVLACYFAQGKNCIRHNYWRNFVWFIFGPGGCRVIEGVHVQSLPLYVHPVCMDGWRGCQPWKIHIFLTIYGGYWPTILHSQIPLWRQLVNKIWLNFLCCLHFFLWSQAYSDILGVHN